MKKLSIFLSLLALPNVLFSASSSASASAGGGCCGGSQNIDQLINTVNTLSSLVFPPSYFFTTNLGLPENTLLFTLGDSVPFDAEFIISSGPADFFHDPVGSPTEIHILQQGIYEASFIFSASLAPGDDPADFRAHFRFYLNGNPINRGMSYSTAGAGGFMELEEIIEVEPADLTPDAYSLYD